jgi:hypothetical protein
MDQDDLKKQLKKNKPKSKLTVPAEFLDGAKSYDDKLVLVKYLTEKEKNRIDTYIMFRCSFSWIRNNRLAIGLV